MLREAFEVVGFLYLFRFDELGTVLEFYVCGHGFVQVVFVILEFI